MAPAFTRSFFFGDFLSGMVGSGVRNDVHALKAEEWGGEKKVAVVGIHFRKAVLGGASEVEGVGGADVGGRRGGGKHGFQAHHHRFSDREEFDQA